MSKSDVFECQIAFDVFFVLEVLVILNHVLNSLVNVIDVVLLAMRQELSCIPVLLLVAKLPDFSLADKFVVIKLLLLWLGVPRVETIVEEVRRVAKVEA